MAAESPEAPDGRRLAVMEDVAAMAGVSAMTVSRVLNAPEKVRPQTRARVMAAVGPWTTAPTPRRASWPRAGPASSAWSASTPRCTARRPPCSASSRPPARTTTRQHRQPRAPSTAGRSGRAWSGSAASRSTGSWSSPRTSPRRTGCGAAARPPARRRRRRRGRAVPRRRGRPPGRRRARRAAPAEPRRTRPCCTWRARPTGWTPAGASTAGAPRWRPPGREVPPPPAGDWSARSGYEFGKQIAADPEVTAVFAANDAMALGLCAPCARPGGTCPATSAWWASTTSPRPPTSRRRSPPSGRTSPRSGGGPSTCCSTGSAAPRRRDAPGRSNRSSSSGRARGSRGDLAPSRPRVRLRHAPRC